MWNISISQTEGVADYEKEDCDRNYRVRISCWLGSQGSKEYIFEFP